MPGFGDPKARLVIIGLAPAAHGANRTGRVFTGDGVGGSGDFLMAALHRAGFANIATSHDPADGLALRDAFIAAAVRCAPPANKPTPEEIARCLPHLAAEIDALPRVRVVVALGKIGFDAFLQLLKTRGDGAPAAAAVRARAVARAARRTDADRLLPPEPAEHEHRQAHAADDGRDVFKKARANEVYSEFQVPSFRFADLERERGTRTYEPRTLVITSGRSVMSASTPQSSKRLASAAVSTVQT